MTDNTFILIFFIFIYYNIKKCTCMIPGRVFSRIRGDNLRCPLNLYLLVGAWHCHQ